MHILVTGASGFIGFNLVRRLSKKHKIRVFIRRKTKVDRFKKLGVEIFYGDVLNKHSLIKALKDIEAVYHLAGALPNSSLSPKTFWEVNVRGTENILSVVQNTPSIKHLIYCSTAYVGWGKEHFTNEESECKPETVYEKSKYEAEKKVIDKIGKVNFYITIIRPGLVYGNYSKGFIPLFKTISQRRFFFVGQGDHLFELTHVDDLTNLFQKLLNNHKAYNQTFIISESKPKTFKEIVQIIAYLLDKPVPKLSVNRVIFLLFLKLLILLRKFTGINIPFSEDSLKTLTLDRKFNTTKARTILKYKTKVPIEKGIKELIEWYHSKDLL